MKRKLALILAALLLTATVGCGSEKPANDTHAADTSASAESETTVAESETAIDYAAALPEADYEGYNFRMLSKSPE